MVTVIMPRYLDTPQRIKDMEVRENGALKTLAIGIWGRIVEGETVEAEEFKDVCGSARYSDLVTRVDQKTCVFVEVEHTEPSRIKS